MIIWHPSADHRYTRRQLVRDGARAVVATIVVGTVADLVAACGGQTQSPSTSTTSAGGSAATAASAPPSASPGAAPSTSTGAVVQGGTLHYGTIGDVAYGSLDMTTTTGTSDAEVALGMEDAYIYLTSDGKFVPGLAESWDMSPDGLTYTFKLRQGVTFHDGTPFNADAVKYNFDRITDKKRNPNGLSYSYIGAGVSYDGCEVVDPYTVRHHLKTPNAIFLYRLRRVWFSPQSPPAIDKWGSEYFRHPVSVGPFKFVEWVQGDHVTMAANPDYKWGPNALFPNTGKPYLDQVVHRIITDLSTKASALESGELEYAAGLNPTDVARFQHTNGIAVRIRDQMGQSVQISLNVEKPPTDDLAVRQAISWGIDRDALSKTVFLGLYPPATHIFTPNLWSYDASLNSLNGYDPQKAGQILDAAGWKMGSNGVRAKNGQELRIRWLDGQSAQAEVQFVQAQLKKIGVAVDIQIMPSSALLEATLRGDHNATAGTGNWIQEDPDVLRNWLASSLINVRQNYVRVRDPKLDALLNQGIAFVGDPHSPEREKVYQQLQQTVMQNYYVIPLVYPKSLEAYRPTVQADNIGYDPYGTYHYWNNVWIRK